MDFLGLRNLTVLNSALKMIKRNHGITITHQELLETIHDPRSFILMGKGQTQGIFQLEGSGMTSFFMQYKPLTFAEVTAGISLYRPGPMDFIPRYLDNRANPSHIVYLHPKLEKHLKNTYGVITYQEQCMSIAVDLAGYNGADSDDFRRAISKKKQKEIDKHRGLFVYGREEEVDKVTGRILALIPGCIKLGIPEDIAIKIFEEMEGFAKYAFNKSHAAAYGTLTCETGWIAYMYPPEFMAALMTSVSGSLPKVSNYINHCQRTLGIEVLPSDVNESFSEFVATKEGKIRFGMSATLNVGPKIVDEICMERKNNGKFRSFTDFLERMDGSANRSCIESLIKCGAFDSTKNKRSQLMVSLDDIKDVADKYRKSIGEGQDILFRHPRNIVDNVLPLEEYPKKIILAMEKEMTGLYISGHPLDAISHYIDETSTIKTTDLVIEEGEEDDILALETFEPQILKYYEGMKVTLVCIINSVHAIITKKNQPMAFVTVDDLYGSVEVVVFPQLYESTKDIIIDDNVIRIIGSISIKDSKVSILANMIDLVEIKIQDKLYVEASSLAQVNAVISCIKGNTGELPVYLVNNCFLTLLSEVYWTNDQGIRELQKHKINYRLRKG